MTLFCFDLVVEGRDITDVDAMNALYHASESTNDDISPHWRDGMQYAGLMREAICLEHAVLVGIQQVESIGGVKVVGIVDTSFVTLGEIAKRAGRTEEAIQDLVDGISGPGGFPGGMELLDDEPIEWPWDQVVEWFRSELEETIAYPDADTYEFLDFVLRTRLRGRSTAPEHRRQLAELIVAGDPLELPAATQGQQSLFCEDCANDGIAAAD